jgi:hypothetical protein
MRPLSPARLSRSANDAKSKYREWLHEQYLDFVSVLIDVLRTGEPAVLAVPCLKVNLYVNTSANAHACSHVLN